MRLENVGGKSQSHVSGSNRVKAGLHKMEDTVRRQVRAVAHGISTSFHHEETDEAPARKVRQGIVSINGQDVETMQCTGRKRA
jgi:hypothetical protein